MLANRKKLAACPGISIKPDMNTRERAIENILLRKRRELIIYGAPSVSKCNKTVGYINVHAWGYNIIYYHGGIINVDGGIYTPLGV